MAEDWSGKPGAVVLNDGRTLAYLQYGDPRGLPCILIHDTPGTARTAGWQLNGAPLPRRVRIIAVDRLGWGSSGKLHARETAAQARSVEADAISRLIRVLALRSVPVIGIGSGALVAMAVASAHPDTITAVTCLSPRLPSVRSTGRGGVIDGWRRARAGVRRERSLPFLPGIAEIGDSYGEWAALIRRMDPQSRAVIGNRWQDQAFRTAYQLDADATAGSQAYTRTVPEETPEGSGAETGGRFDMLSGPVPMTVFSGPDDERAPELQRWLGDRPGVRYVTSPEQVTAAQQWPDVLAETFAVHPIAV